jgi:hypothetical protein
LGLKQRTGLIPGPSIGETRRHMDGIANFEHYSLWHQLEEQMCLTYSQRETSFLKLDYSSVRWCQVEVRVNKRAQVPKTCTIMRVPEKEQSRTTSEWVLEVGGCTREQ